MNTNLDAFIDMIFSCPPKDICSYNLIIKNNNNNPFGILMDIFIAGAKKLYGDTIKPQQMTTEQFDLIKKYMLSLGYRTKNNYTFLEGSKSEKIPYMIHIWFEKIKQTRDCSGQVMYL